jgi:phosphatidylinositol 4-kinase
MIAVLGGQDSNKFDDFRKRMARGFIALQENAEKIIILVEMMLNGQSDLPCFIGGRNLIRDLKDRLFPNLRRMTLVEA